MYRIVKQSWKTFPTALAVLLLPLGAPAASRTAQLPDGTIRSLVEHRLAKHGLEDTGVLVQVDDGVVTLSGSVKTLADEQEAEKLARSAEEVKDVVDRLSVQPGTRSEQQIADDVAKALNNYRFYDVFDWVEARLEGGQVSLTGWVYRPWDSAWLEKRIKRIAGVTRVQNELQSLPPSTYDDELRFETFRAIYGDPLFSTYPDLGLAPIHIIVHNGHITLKGIVHSKVERQLAGSLTRHATLALSVDNDIQLESRS
jgi:osmotically-inducible protein OsmY